MQAGLEERVVAGPGVRLWATQWILALLRASSSSFICGPLWGSAEARTGRIWPEQVCSVSRCEWEQNRCVSFRCGGRRQQVLVWESNGWEVRHWPEKAQSLLLFLPPVV